MNKPGDDLRVLDQDKQKRPLLICEFQWRQLTAFILFDDFILGLLLNYHHHHLHLSSLMGMISSQR